MKGCSRIMKKSMFGRRILNAAAVIGLVGASTLGLTGAANAAPAGSEWPSSWTITGNTATGTTPSGVTITATLTGPATFTGTGTTSAPATQVYVPATMPILGTTFDPAACGTGPSGCGSITYTFSKPVTSPSLAVYGAGASASQGGPYGAFSNAPVTLTSGGTFSLDQLGQNTANEIRNNGTTIGMTQTALNNNIGKLNTAPSSCDTSSSAGVAGCGSYLINTGNPAVTSITMGLSYAKDTNGDGTRTAPSRNLGLAIVPVADPAVPMIDPTILAAAGAGTAAAAGGAFLIASSRKTEPTTTN